MHHIPWHSQHFVIQLFLVLQTQEGFYCIFVKRQRIFIIIIFFNIFVKCGFSIPVCCTHLIASAGVQRLEFCLLFFSIMFLGSFNICCDITNTQVWPIAPLKWSGILKICLRASASASFQYHYYYFFGLVSPSVLCLYATGSLAWSESTVILTEYNTDVFFFSGDAKIKAVCHFDRLQGWFIRTCNSNSFVVHLYAATNMNHTTSLTVSSLITASSFCPARCFSCCYKLQKLHCRTFLSLAKPVEMSLIKGLREEEQSICVQAAEQSTHAAIPTPSFVFSLREKSKP